MDVVDRIKTHHLATFIGIGIQIGQAAEMYGALSADQRAQLKQRVQTLIEHVGASHPLPLDGLWLEVVCLAFAMDVPPSGQGSLHVTLSEQPEALTRRNFGAEAFTAKRVHRALRRYAALPTSERADLARFASGLGIDLPLGEEDRPLALLAALARLGQRVPGGGMIPRDELVEAYRQLSVEEGRTLADAIIHVWQTDPEAYLQADWRLEGSTTGLSEVQDPLMHLACLVPGALKGSHEALIEAGVFYPGELYRDADAPARDHLLRLLETPPYNEEALEPLVWIGDDLVQQTFHRWRTSPPAWRPRFAESLDQYGLTKDAGWQLMPDGRRRDLYHMRCFRLIPRHRTPNRGPVEVVTRHEARCGHCKLQLATLFDIDLQDQRLAFLAPGWNRLRIAMCNRCKPYTTIFTEVDGEGRSHWSDLNEPGGDLLLYRRGWRFPQRRLMLGPPRRSPYEAHFGILSRGASQIGGFPTWEQGNSHPQCPKCGRWMVFVGQVETGDALGEGEGVTYAFLCQECGMAATAYEQD